MSTPNSKEKVKEDKTEMVIKSDNGASDIESLPNNDAPATTRSGNGMEFMMSANDVGYMGFGFNGFGK